MKLDCIRPIMSDMSAAMAKFKTCRELGLGVGVEVTGVPVMQCLWFLTDDREIPVQTQPAPPF